MSDDSEWIEHDGKGIPVNADAIVEVECRDEWRTSYPTPAHEWMDHSEGTDGMWVHRGYLTDIIAYRVVKP